MNDSKCLLVLKTPQHLSKAQIESLTDLITPTAEALGAEPMVLGSGFEVELQTGSQALLERVCVALEEIAAQGRMPEVNVAEIAPQALNARPTGLNARPANPSKVNVVEDATKAGSSRVRTLSDGSEVLDVFVKDLFNG